MDLNDIWQSNRKFILAVCAAFVIFLIGKGLISSGWSTTRVQSNVTRDASKLRREAAPGSSELSRVRAQNTDLEAKLSGLYGGMSFATEGDYLLPKDEASPDLLYNEIRSRAVGELVDGAARRNIQVDESLGLPEFTPSGREAIQRCLTGLNIVEQVVTEAIVAGVRSVPEIEIVEARGRSRQKSEGFVVPLKVRFRVEGSTASICEFVEALVGSGGQFLSIEDAEIDVNDKKSLGLTRCKFTVSGLAIDPDAIIGEARRR